MMLSVRPAAPDDAPHVAVLAAELGYPSSDEVVRERLNEVAGSSRRAVAVAEIEGQINQINQIIGWIEVEERETLAGGGTVEITALVVSAAARRTGTGRALVAFARDWAQARGAATLRVRSNTAREAAAAFYPAIGFACEKTQRVYVTRLTPHAPSGTTPVGTLR